MTTTQPPQRRQIIKWTTPKGFAALVLFVIIAALIETTIILAFQIIGLWDPNAWTTTTLIPGTNLSFTISISPLFHLLPLSVIIVLLTSWQYLTKYTAYAPQRTETAKHAQPPTRRTQEKQRFKTLRQFTKRLTRRLQRTGRNLKTSAEKTKGISYISQRFSLAKTTVRSALTIIFTFLAFLLIIGLIEYPDSIHQLALNLYRSSPALLNFVRGIGQAFGQVGTSIYHGLAPVGPGLRSSLQSIGAALTQPITNANLDTKYVLSQNVAAWTSAIFAVIYGAYASAHPRRRPRGR